MQLLGPRDPIRGEPRPCIAPVNACSMTISHAEVPSLYGYITIVEDSQGGFLGGALVVNQRGRPIEFHCTDTLLVSRAEEILYGATLRPHLFGDRLGASLLAKIASKVEVVLVNQPELLQLGDNTIPPVVLVTGGDVTAADDPPAEMPLPARLDLVPEEVRADVAERLASLTRCIALAEPFTRIVDAMAEAGQTAPVEEVPRGQAA